jgi:2-polyprenyl-6-methoxyphenol hydroxylase-like FAD-dependent oxidoreductase
MSGPSVLVIGGGITGSVLSLALAQGGARVDLVEIRADWRGAGHGITVQGNALAAFAKVGVLDALMARGVSFDTLRMRRADGTLIAELPVPRTGGAALPATMGALRSDLQDVLCERVYAAGVTVRLGLTVRSITQDGLRARAAFTDGSTGDYDLIVGADGIRSAVRGMLGFAAGPQPSGMSIWRAVADRPAELDCSELYYDGPRYKAGYTPISASQCYAFLLDVDGTRRDFGDRPDWAVMYERSAGYGGTWSKVRDGIGPHSSVVHTRIEWLLLDDPWYRGRVIVIGDAAHACPPLIAQGAAMCAEDAVVLAELVTGGLPLDRALPAFMARRMPRVEIVVRNSMRLVRYEMGTEPHTDADVAHAMSSTLDFLAAGPA